jgi:hypothetical protein
MERQLKLEPVAQNGARNFIFAGTMMTAAIGVVVALFVAGILSQVASLAAVIIPAGICFAFVLPRSRKRLGTDPSPRVSNHRI